MSYVHNEAKSSRHCNLRLLRSVFLAWLERTEYRRECSDSEESDNETDENRSFLMDETRTERSRELPTIASDGEDGDDGEAHVMGGTTD